MEILKIITVNTISHVPFCILIISSILFIFFLIGSVKTTNEYTVIFYIMITCFFAIVIIVVIIFTLCGDFTTSEEQIIARIDDSYPLNEIYNNYKIISKEKYSNVYYLVKLVK